jgi:sulfite reductase (NADPH) flavoprotein alpha-component
MKISPIPHNAPYSDAQRAWLGGFFAGMQKSAAPSSQSDAHTLHILYGSQTGNSESVAHDVASAAKAKGLAVVIKSMADVDIDSLIKMEYLLIVTSTYGEGEMPDSAQMLWNQLSADDAPTMEQTKYAVLALGDTSYDLFCQAGIELDARLAGLGAERLADRVDCDVDFDERAEEWTGRIIPIVAEGAITGIAESEESPQSSTYNRKNTFATNIRVNRLLTAEKSSKETRHYEFSLEGSGLSYEAGDALNVVPQNCPELVGSIIKAIGCDDDEGVTVNGQSMPLSEALRTYFEIKLPSKDLLQAVASQSADKEFNDLLTAGDKAALAKYLWGRDTLDLLLQFPAVTFSATEFIALLKPLQHRAYSISSSGKMYPDSVHLTVASVRYNSYDRDHKGVCSTYMADLVDNKSDVKIFFSPNTSFRVPEDDSLPIIMVGPGTGIAPFRAFLQEREFRKASGKNWLLFGDRNKATDYIYQDEIEAMQERGILTRLDLAFSRDQEEKIYVQDKMCENGEEMFSWLEQGGAFYVCGDANYMAKDVDKALHALIEQHGNKTAEQAIEYVDQLKKEKRYVRDVY